MPKFQVSIEYDDSGYRFGYTLIVKHNGEIILEECDHGEPEDNSFMRDYAWIKPALEKAYNLGLTDAVNEVQH
jgi:hypothetical protein